MNLSLQADKIYKRRLRAPSAVTKIACTKSGARQEPHHGLGLAWTDAFYRHSDSGHNLLLEYTVSSKACVSILMFLKLSSSTALHRRLLTATHGLTSDNQIVFLFSQYGAHSASCPSAPCSLSCDLRSIPCKSTLIGTAQPEYLCGKSMRP